MNNFELCDGVLVLVMFCVTLFFISVMGNNLDKSMTYIYYLLIISPFMLYYSSRIIYLYGLKCLNYFKKNKLDTNIDIDNNHSNI